MKTYFIDGSLESEGYYQKSTFSKTGAWKEYYNSGQLYAEGTMNNGFRSGTWKIYHENGQLLGTGEYASDGFPGLNSWITYDPSGKADNLNCPPPTEIQIRSLASSIYISQEYQGEFKFSYQYQYLMWKMAGADPSQKLPNYPPQKWETLKEIEGYQKVGKMWNAYSGLFRAWEYPTSLATDKNMMKFSIDVGMTAFFLEGLKVYHLNVNFIDPADGKTVLDWLTERIVLIKNEVPVNEDKVREYERYVELLLKQGAKHANEL